MRQLLGNKKAILVIAVVLALAAALLLWQRGRLFGGPAEEEQQPAPVEAPLRYTLEEVTMMALPVGSGTVVYPMEAASLAAQAAAEEAGEEEPEPPAEPEETEEPEENAYPLVAYRYEEMEDAPALLRAYAALLTTQDIGFRFADRTLKDAREEPDLAGEEGEVYLTCPVVNEEVEEGEESHSVALRLAWTERSCAVTAELIPTALTLRPEEEGPGEAVLTFTRAVSIIQSMPPAVLGLEGDSMDSYRVYARDGLVLVDGQGCMRVDVYGVDAQLNANVAAGSYVLSADGRHLYSLDREAGRVTELDVPREQLASLMAAALQ